MAILFIRQRKRGIELYFLDSKDSKIKADAREVIESLSDLKKFCKPEGEVVALG